MTIAFYNEVDPYAAQWLRNLIGAGHIAPGIVDERDIRDISPADLADFTQCHFFAGIGIWSHSLRLAEWSDNRTIWTGSCPCQPFSAAGRGAGIADERHLWPHWFWLIEQCRPDVVLGEQVASKDGLGWLDIVSTDMENAGYAFGAVDTCAAGVTMEWQTSQSGEWLDRAIRDCGDPGIAADLRDFADWAGANNIGEGGKHIRQRLYFVGLADSTSWGGGDEREQRGRQHGFFAQDGSDLREGSCGPRIEPVERLADAMPTGRAERRPVSGIGQITGLRAASRLGQSSEPRPQGVADGRNDVPRQGGPSVERAGGEPIRSMACDGRTNAPDVDREPVDWLFGRDAKWRAVRSGSFPLVNGAAARVGRLRAYGNGLDAKTARQFCEVVREIIVD